MPSFSKLFLFFVFAAIIILIAVFGISKIQNSGIYIFRSIFEELVGMLLFSVSVAAAFSFAAKKILFRPIISLMEKKKEMDYVKDEFFMLASHEMRSPLTAIRGNLELIKDMVGN